MKKNIILDKSFDFSLKVIGFYSTAVREHREYIISKQLLRAGTSIGANVSEAQSASSKRDFIHKLEISLKESRETSYWLRLIKYSDLYKGVNVDELLNEVEALISILVAIIKNGKKSSDYH